MLKIINRDYYGISVIAWQFGELFLQTLLTAIRSSTTVINRTKHQVIPSIIFYWKNVFF